MQPVAPGGRIIARDLAQAVGAWSHGRGEIALLELFRPHRDTPHGAAIKKASHTITCCGNDNAGAHELTLHPRRAGRQFMGGPAGKLISEKGDERIQLER